MELKTRLLLVILDSTSSLMMNPFLHVFVAQPLSLGDLTETSPLGSDKSAGQTFSRHLKEERV